MTRFPDLRLNLALVALLLALALASLAIGPAALSPRTVFDALMTGDGVPGLIVREIRLPRTLLALAIGGTLGLSGAALQGLVRNPLAEPALFGAPQAAAAAASFVIAFGFFPATSYAVPFAAIAGALVSIGGLVAIAGRRASLTVTLLAGLALASFAGAATALALNLAPNPFAAIEIAFWLLGSLQDRSSEHLYLAAPFLALGCVLMALNARAFRALTLGEDAATSLGVNVDMVRLRVVIGVALGVGAAVAVVGAIGFVGLVAPHLIRRAVGSDPARVMLPGALAGAALLLASDIAVRLVPGPVEIKLGVVTALIGVPFFLVMIFAERRALQGDAVMTMLRAERIDVVLHGRAVVSDASVALKPGEFTALVGPNGAGKTTLMRALAGLLPASGSIRLKDRPLSDFTLRERARSIAYLPQGNVFHWPLDVAAVVGLGRHPHADPFSPLSGTDRAAVAHALAAAQIEDLADRIVTTLSGGERARVALARVLATEADILFADEPTASLDPRHQLVVMDLLRGIARRGGAVLAIIHDLGLAARFADRVLVMQRGRVVADAAPRDALDDARLAEVFGIAVAQVDSGDGVMPVPLRPV